LLIPAGNLKDKCSHAFDPEVLGAFATWGLLEALELVHKPLVQDTADDLPVFFQPESEVGFCRCEDVKMTRRWSQVLLKTPSENTLTCEHLMMSQHEVNQKTGNPKKPMPSCKPLGHDEAPRESK